MNSEKWKNSGMARLFLWMVKAKYTMGIFFVVFVIFYLLFGLVASGQVIMLDFFTAVQMVFACFFIGILQQAVLPVEKLSRTRCIVWVASGVAVTILFSLVFGWFKRFPVWCHILFAVVIALGMIAMIAGYYLELHKETKRLNRNLERFQNKKRRTEG